VVPLYELARGEEDDESTPYLQYQVVNGSIKSDNSFTSCRSDSSSNSNNSNRNSNNRRR
jgi:hypothetical protein